MKEPVPTPSGRDFEAWYAEHSDGLLRSVTATIDDPMLAREALAEALARAFEKWERIGALDSPAGWVHTTAVNLCRRSWRRRALERRALAKHRSDGRYDTAREQETDTAMALTPHLEDLPPRMRQAVELRYWQEMSEAEVATEMGVAVGTASALLTQARQRLAPAIAGDALSNPDDTARSRSNQWNH